MSFQDEIHLKVLRRIHENPAINLRELAADLGVSLGKTNYCLKALIKKGLVKIENFRRNERKAGYLYLLTHRGIEEKAVITLRFLRRKMDEYDRLREEIEQLQAQVIVQEKEKAE